MTEESKLAVSPTSLSLRLLVVVGGVFCAVAASYLLADSKNSKTKSPRLTDAAKSVAQPSNGKKFPTVVRPGPSAPKLLLATEAGSVEVNCNTCHGQRRSADTANRGTADLKEFHQSMRFSHHNLSCLSCHNPDDYESLRMADGTRVEFPEVMKLCAQCHGNVYRDYLHGAHGGMTGHWDLTKGPRMRNNCVDCHHPHTPQFPKMKPTFKPHDRFLTPEPEHH